MDDVTDAKPRERAKDLDMGNLPMLLGYVVRRAQMAVFEDFHARFAAEDIRPAQYSVLKLIALNPGAQQTAVAAALGIQRSNFGPMLDVLERRGLARRRPLEGDRRAVALFLTEAGEAMMTRLDALVEAHEAEFVTRIGAQQKVTLQTLLFLVTLEK